MLRKVLIGLFLLVTLAVIGIVVLLALGRQRLGSLEVVEGGVRRVTGTYAVDLEHDGRARSYLLHVPPAAAGDAPLPLFVLLHGGGSRADRMDALTGLVAIADREGFLLALPLGVDKNWNDGRRDAGSTAAKENVDDVGFIRAVVADIGTKLPLDSRRVYAAGISNGAMMSQRLACEAADIFAAVGIVAGTAPVGFEATCQPARPIAVIAFLSTKDPLVPYEGGTITAFLPFIKRGKVVSAAALKRFWIEADRCNPTPAESEIPDQTTADNSRVFLEAYTECAGGAAVAFYRVEGAGHTWPGGKQYLSPLLVGTTNRDLDASETIWRFFAEHPLP